MRFIDEIETRGCAIVFIWWPHIAGDEWAFEASTLAGTTLLQTSVVSVSRARIDMLRDDLIKELDARGIEVVEVDDAMMLSAIDGWASVALH